MTVAVHHITDPAKPSRTASHEHSVVQIDCSCATAAPRCLNILFICDLWIGCAFLRISEISEAEDSED